MAAEALTLVEAVEDPHGRLRLAAKQRPLIDADEHYGDPAASCIWNESEFALTKPLTECAPPPSAHREDTEKASSGQRADAMTLPEMQS